MQNMSLTPDTKVILALGGGSIACTIGRIAITIVGESGHYMFSILAVSVFSASLVACTTGFSIP